MARLVSFLKFNKKKNSLKGHLLSGLNTDGVPSILKNTVYTFDYNNLNQFNSIINNHKISAVMMEVSRNYQPKNNFLKQIRKITKKKILLLYLMNAPLVLGKLLEDFTNTMV